MLFQDRKTLNISGDQINNLELASIVNQAKRFASTDPARAHMLMDLAEQIRPDGSPSLAASAPAGYSTLQALREEIANTIVADAETQRKEAERTLQESTKDNYVQALTDLSQLEGADAVNAWAADNVDGLTQEQFKAHYGDYRGEVLNAVSRFRSGQKSQGNDTATAEYMEAIQRGVAEWEDIHRDERLSDLQRQRLFAAMNEQTQKAQLGYMPDATLAGKLLSDLEASWSDSVYATPWMASQQIEPGKPPLVTPEGLYYQGQLLKRLRTLDPDLDVTTMNQKKMEMLQEVKDDILSGKIRWRDQAVSLQEPYPELKLDQKLKEGERLSDANVVNIAKAFNGGGVQQVRDSFGIDYFNLDGVEQKRIAAEAQRQKAELDALHADTFFGRITSDETEEALRVFSDQIMGLPVDMYDPDPEISGRGLGDSVERERAKLENLEARLEEVKRTGHGLANLNTIILERDVKRQREYYDLLKGRHDAHMKAGKGKP
ncbi:MAG: hypothetical protein LUE17_08710 [Planctomycetaceae bacterium]|nr:hypothetical protein [Planctomycetaceae bacterium]